jgi:pilus assembly protein CpaD
MSMTRTLCAGLACLPLLAGCLPTKPNYGVDSVNKPVVANGRAHVPGCPDWSSAGSDSAALTDSNFGCAVNTNLAAMLADPNDLVRGRSDDGMGSEVPARSIKAWREVQPTSKQWVVTVQESASSGGSGGPK